MSLLHGMLPKVGEMLEYPLKGSGLLRLLNKVNGLDILSIILKPQSISYICSFLIRPGEKFG